MSDAPSPPSIDIAGNLAAVRRDMTAAAVAAGRDPAAVALIAVSKFQGPPAVRMALEAGQRIFGENRVQEAQAKWPALRQAFAGTELHLIGPLQTNKVRDAVALFDVIETVDRPKLAQALATALQQGEHRLRCYIQVNTGEEPQKAGIPPREADDFIVHCRDALRLPVTGLMCIPPQAEEPAPHFALLAKIAARHGLAEVSMGMSADYRIAIGFGASHVRIGTAIFGPRPAP